MASQPLSAPYASPHSYQTVHKQYTDFELIPFGRKPSWYVPIADVEPRPWRESAAAKWLCFGLIAGTIAAIVITIIMLVKDTSGSSDAPHADTVGPTLSKVPEGCLGPPFILLTFHGGMHDNMAENLKHGRYNGVLKYTRDGCWLGPAIADPNTRLRQIFVSEYPPALLAIAEGNKGQPGNVMQFGNCWDTQHGFRMVPRPLVHRSLLRSNASCMQHLFGLDSPDGGKTVYISSQGSGSIIRFNALSGQPIGAAQDAECPGLFMKSSLYLTENNKSVHAATENVSSGIRGFCFGNDDLFVPYKYAEGLIRVRHLADSISSTKKQQAKFVTNQIIRQPLTTATLIVDNKNTSAAQIPEICDLKSCFLDVDVYGSETLPAMIGGSPGWFEGLDESLHTTHPTTCTVVQNKLYFSTRPTSNTAIDTKDGVIQYDLDTKHARLFTSPELDTVKIRSFLVFEDTLFIMTVSGDADPARRTEAENRVNYMNSGQIWRFNMTSGRCLGPLLSKDSPSRLPPDQPEQMAWSAC